MLKIRLSRVGKSHTPIYRLVVAEKSRAVKRENIEILGLYNPSNKEDKFQVKKDRVLHWMSLGAQPSDTARNLLCDFDVLPKKSKVKIVHGKATKKKADKEAAGKKPEVIKEDKEAVEDKESEKAKDDDQPVETPEPIVETSTETEANVEEKPTEELVAVEETTSEKSEK